MKKEIKFKFISNQNTNIFLSSLKLVFNTLRSKSFFIRLKCSSEKCKLLIKPVKILYLFLQDFLKAYTYPPPSPETSSFLIEEFHFQKFHFDVMRSMKQKKFLNLFSSHLKCQNFHCEPFYKY